jgi:hypothetical protein
VEKQTLSLQLYECMTHGSRSLHSKRFDFMYSSVLKRQLHALAGLDTKAGGYDPPLKLLADFRTLETCRSKSRFSQAPVALEAGPAWSCAPVIALHEDIAAVRRSTIL